MPSIEDAVAYAVEQYQRGHTCKEIGQTLNRDVRTVSRWLKKNGIEVKIPGRSMGSSPKRNKYGEQVLSLHHEGKTVPEIIRILPENLHYTTVELWIKEAGFSPHKAYEADVLGSRKEKRTHKIELVQDYLAGEYPHMLATKYGVNHSTVHRWIREEGVTGLGGKAVHESPSTENGNICAAPECNSLTKSKTVKYCSEACRSLNQRYRQPNPKNYSTQDCETCGKSFTRYIKYGSGALRFCSNPCAAKFTRKIQHIGVDGVVLDSGWEALFWGLCKFLKVAIERVDRSTAVEYEPGHWYAPDFKVEGHYVEVKGLEDSEDPLRWSRWAQERVGDGRARLLVLNHYSLDELRKVSTRDELLEML